MKSETDQPLICWGGGGGFGIDKTAGNEKIEAAIKNEEGWDREDCERWKLKFLQSHSVINLGAN